MIRTYPRLRIEPFGRTLLTSGDLDPVYLALNRSGFSYAQTARWLTAYAAFYHCGAACYLSEIEGLAFWDEMDVAAANLTKDPTGQRWPRGRERRHMRGHSAIVAMLEWRQRYGAEPEAMFTYIAGAAPDFLAVYERALEHRSVGDWLGFKIVDLVDACLHGAIDQSDVTPFLYASPVKGLLLAYSREYHQHRPETWRWSAVMWMLETLRAAYTDLRVPHHPARPIDLFCLETIACKYGAHQSGHYPLYTDLTEIGEGLAPWAIISPAARRFLAVMPPVPATESLLC
jgi:Alpha-glutamyl/putrescinyl thymine pyrophosphorylase clade 2